MAGHSKWANIQHRKGRQDAKRGKLFTKLIREITVTAKLGGEDPNNNPRLRAAIDNALANNMAKDTINRAIKRGGKSGEINSVEEIRYEGFGPDGVAIIVDCITDNKNRTVAEVRHIFISHGGNLGTSGSVAYLFKKVGVIRFYANETDEDKLTEAAIQIGSEDLINDGDSINILTTPEDFSTIKQQLIELKFQPIMARLEMRAAMLNILSAQDATPILSLLNALEELEDVQDVFANIEIRN